MTDISKQERLSALVDGELEAFERRRMIGILVEDEASLERWRRDHLLRDALRGELPPALCRDFLARVNAGIDAALAENENEDEPSAHRGHAPLPLWLRAGAGFAVAASVAVVTILGLQSLVGGGAIPAGTAVVASRQAPAAAPRQAGGFRLANTTAPEAVQPGVSDAEVQRRINSYLINHSEFAGRPAMLPYARIVGYETTEPSAR